MSSKMYRRLEKELSTLYDKTYSSFFMREVAKLSKKKYKTKHYRLTQKDAVLITYANSVISGTEKPLQTLDRFIKEQRIGSFINTTHILPFYPWDTDRGFSVTDYYHVDPHYGSWKHIRALAKKQRVMFDFVANHASLSNPLVQRALIERHISTRDRRYKAYAYYKDFVIAYDKTNTPSDQSLKFLARPRSTPVLTPYFVAETSQGPVAFLGTPEKSKTKRRVLGTGYVWTTFSRPNYPDGSVATRQVDLNFANPRVLLETLKILAFYIKNGASLIRLDAIGYIWKKLGASSLHEKEVHAILKIIRKIVSTLAPHVLTISEVNEPQEKFFTYLGTPKNPESDLVYQFCAFPLSLHAVLTGDGSFYQNWYKTTKPFKGRQFITVLGTHDGLGLKPIRNLLPQKQMDHLTDILISKHGGLPNYAILPGGKKIVYEICSTPWNLINNPASRENAGIQVDRYQAVLALGLMVRGMPAIYINGLTGVANYKPQTGLDENRSVNRQSFPRKNIERKLNNDTTVEHAVFNVAQRLLSIRAHESAFSPTAPFPKTLRLKNKHLIGIELTNSLGKGKIIALVNVSDQAQTVILPAGTRMPKAVDLISKKPYDLRARFTLSAYQVVWLKQS